MSVLGHRMIVRDTHPDNAYSIMIITADCDISRDTVVQYQVCGATQYTIADAYYTRRSHRGDYIDIRNERVRSVAAVVHSMSQGSLHRHWV